MEAPPAVEGADVTLDISVMADSLSPKEKEDLEHFFWYQIYLSNKANSKDSFTNDRNAVSLITALLLTITIPEFLSPNTYDSYVFEEDFLSDLAQFFIYLAKDLFFCMSIVFSLLNLLIGTFQYLRFQLLSEDWIFFARELLVKNSMGCYYESFDYFKYSIVFLFLGLMTKQITKYFYFAGAFLLIFGVVALVLMAVWVNLNRTFNAFYSVRTKTALMKAKPKK